MRCRACGSELIAGKAFCHVCGTRVAQACPRCSEEIEAGFRFCPNCGFQLEGAPASGPAATAAAAPPAAAPPAAPPVEVREPPSPMPESLAEKIRALGGALAGERKQVTVLFCDLAGSTAVAGGLDPEVYRE